MANFEFPDGETIRSRLQRVPGVDPRLAAASQAQPPSAVDPLRARLQQYGSQPNPRLTTPLMGPPQGSPADMVRSRIQQIPATADPRVARPLVGPPQSYARAPGAPAAAPGVAGSAPGSSIRQWLNNRLATPGAATPGDAARAALKSGGQAAQKVGGMVGQAVSQLNAGGLLTKAARGVGLYQTGSGIMEGIDNGFTSGAVDHTTLGAATMMNPAVGAIGNLVRLGRNYAIEKGVDLAYADDTAGPELNKTLAGRAPTQYLAQRSADAAAPTQPANGEPLVVSQQDLLALASPEDRKILEANIRANPLERGGIQYQKDGQMYLASLQGLSEPAQATSVATGGRSSVAGGAASMRRATAAPTATSTPPPLLGADDDEVEVIYGNRGSVLHRFGENGDTQRIDVGPGQTKEQARANYIARLAVDQQVSEHLATGAPVPPELIKNYYLAHGLDPKDLLRDEANLQGEQIRADSAGNVANIQAGAHKYQTDSTASLARDGSKEKTRASHVLNDYDEFGMPKGQRIGVVDLQTGAELSNKPAQSYKTPSQRSIEELRLNRKNPRDIQIFEETYGPGSAAQYLQAAEKPKGYAKGGLIRGYAQGGMVGNADYQAGETEENYALRTRSSAGAPSAFGEPSESFSADKVYGMVGANYSANPAFGRIGEHYAQGGPVHGPGSGTSDSVPALIDGVEPAAISDGEYVIPAAVVKRLGVKFFDNLIAKHQSGKTR